MPLIFVSPINAKESRHFFITVEEKFSYFKQRLSITEKSLKHRTNRIADKKEYRTHYLSKKVTEPHLLRFHIFDIGFAYCFFLRTVKKTNDSLFCLPFLRNTQTHNESVRQQYGSLCNRPTKEVCCPSIYYYIYFISTCISLYLYFNFTMVLLIY